MVPSSEAENSIFPESIFVEAFAILPFGDVDPETSKIEGFSEGARVSGLESHN